MLVIPHVANAARSAREAALQADLRLLRTGVAAFHADVGALPVALEQLVDGEYRKNPLPTQSNGTPSPPKGYRGPYLITGDRQLPKDPVTGERTWGYDPATGSIWSYAAGAARDGTAYADW
jgi:hypothetical protein